MPGTLSIASTRVAMKLLQLFPSKKKKNFPVRLFLSYMYAEVIQEEGKKRALKDINEAIKVKQKKENPFNVILQSQNRSKQTTEEEVFTFYFTGKTFLKFYKKKKKNKFQLFAR